MWGLRDVTNALVSGLGLGVDGLSMGSFLGTIFKWSEQIKPCKQNPKTVWNELSGKQTNYDSQDQLGMSTSTIQPIKLKKTWSPNYQDFSKETQWKAKRWYKMKYKQSQHKKSHAGNSLPVQWLGPCALAAEGPGSLIAGSDYMRAKDKPR